MSTKRILIIDDEAPMRYLLERQLCRSGYSVIEAEDGFSGISSAQAHGPDLIVLDMMMPGIDGFEVYRRLRAATATARTPIVFLSGAVNAETRRRAFELGAADVLAKPHQVSELVSVVDGIFRRQEAQTEPAQKGRVVSLYALNQGQSSTGMAVYLSRMVALHTTWPVLLIDLDMVYSPIASRLLLHRSPHVLQLLDHAPVPMTMDEVAPYVQRQHVGLGVIAAPEGSQELDFSVLPRLRAALEELRAVGYYVVLHLGGQMTDLALSAMRGSDLVCALTDPKATDGRYEAFVASVAERGVDVSRLTPVVGDVIENGRRPTLKKPAAPNGSRPASPTRLQRRGLNASHLAEALL